MAAFLSGFSSVVTTLLGFSYTLILTVAWRFPAKRMCVIIPCFLVGMVSLNTAYFFWQGVSAESKVTVSVFNIVLCLLFNVVMAKYPVIQVAFTYTSASLFIFLSDTLCGVIWPQPGIGHILTKVIVYPAVGLLLLFFFRRPFVDALREFQRRWLSLMLVPLVICFVFFFVVQRQGPLYTDPQFRSLILGFCICTICIYISYYFIFCGLRDQFRVQADRDTLETHISSMRKHVQTLQSVSDKMQVFRHDMRHFIRMQSACLKNGDLEGAKKSLNDVSTRLDLICNSYKQRVYTGQPFVDAVLSYYADQSEEKEIQFQVKLEMPEHLADTEFAVVLSNAVENALIGCEKTPDGHVKEIHILGGCHNNQFCLEISNTYSGQVEMDAGGMPVSSEDGHGIGTRSMRFFVEKHHANLFFLPEPEMFRLQLLIPQ